MTYLYYPLVYFVAVCQHAPAVSHKTGIFQQDRTVTDSSQVDTHQPPLEDVRTAESVTEVPLGEDNTIDESPLWIFYDCCTTGLSVYNEHIIEIAAKVIKPEPSHSPKFFFQLVQTQKKIPQQVSRHTGIYQGDLQNARPLNIVVPLFLNWVNKVTQEVSTTTGSPHYPVLVAHNGFKFAFPILFAEVERRDKLSLTSFITHNVHFSDSRPLLDQMKKGGDVNLQGVSLNLQDLYNKFVKNFVGVHRASSEVEALEKVLTCTQLKKCLWKFPINKPLEQLSLWFQRKGKHDLIKEFGVTDEQAKQLFSVGLHLLAVWELHVESQTSDDFKTRLQERGITSRTLRVKLDQVLQQSQ